MAFFFNYHLHHHNNTHLFMVLQTNRRPQGVMMSPIFNDHLHGAEVMLDRLAKMLTSFLILSAIPRMPEKS
jgi:hypothetical protein